MKYFAYILLFSIGLVNISFTKGRVSSVWENASKEEFLAASEKASIWFTKNTNFKVDIVYSSFKDHTSSNAHDVYLGFYKRQNNSFSSSAMGVLTIQNDKMRISVDSVNKLILLQNKTEVNQAPADMKSSSELLDRVKSIKKQKLENGDISYRLDFKPNELYSAYEFTINNKGMLVSMKYLYSKELKSEEEDKVIKGKPRLEVSFSNYQTDLKFNYEKEFSEQIYLKEDGKNIVLNDSYKKYEFKDYRYAVKK